MPKPAKIPRCDEFGKMLALDVFEEKDAEGNLLTFLSVI